MEGHRKKTIVWVCSPYFKLDGNEYKEVLSKVPVLAGEKTLVVSAKADLVDAYRIRRGFSYLKDWDMAAPLSGAGHSLEDVLAEREKVKVKAMMADLRVPLLEGSFVWFSARAKETFFMWQSLQKRLNHSSAALTVAVYKTCPFIMVLPTSWVWAGGEDGMVRGKKTYIKNTANYDIERAGRVFRAGHRKRVFLPISLEAEIRACKYLEIEETGQ